MSSPSYRQRIPFNQRRNRIHLTWNNSNQQPMYYQVEVSKDYLFKTLLTKHITSSRSIDLFLAEGAYYWRIKSMLNNSKSVAGFFFLEKELKLKLLQPFHEKKIKYIKKFPGIQVLWNDLPQIYGYKLTVASDKKFTKEVVTFTTHNRYLFLEGKDYNRHKHLILYWKVNAISNSFNPQEITSSTHKIYFSRQKKIKPVIPISPRYDQQVSNWVLQSNHLTFSWQHSFLEKDPQTQYTLEVAKSNKFQSIIYRRVTTKLILKTNLNSRSKILYWRVISNKNKQKLFSKIMRFSITNKELETISPRFNASYDLTQVLHTGINLHWKSALITGTYSVIYGKKVNLRNAKKINLKNKKMIKLSLKQPGTYYWKVVFHSKDNSIIRETKVQVFKINKSLAIAKIIYPYNNQIINFSQIDYLTFRWKKVVGATQYIFKLFQISKHGVKFTPVVKIVTQVKSTFYNLVDLSKLDVARFYWTIKPIKQDNKARIIQAGPESQRYFSIYLPHQVSKLNLQVIE